MKRFSFCLIFFPPIIKFSNCWINAFDISAVVALKAIHATYVKAILPQPLPHLYTSYLTATALEIEAYGATCLQIERTHRAKACHRAPGECHWHMFLSTSWVFLWRMMSGEKNERAARVGKDVQRRETAPHTRHLRHPAHNARKRPRLRPSYITWNPFVLLQCICTPPFTPSTRLQRH